MTETSASAPDARYERQRFEHLVLGRPRQPLDPKTLTKPAGMSRAEWKYERKRLIAAGATLAPGIEEAVALRERWSHKEGTPQTHEAHARRRPGAIARLHASGAIDSDQLAYAQQIAAAIELIGGDVLVKTASLETRVDVTRMGDGTFYEALGRVRLEVAYSAWRRRVKRPALLLEMIAGDVGLALAAARHRVDKKTAKRLLIEALELWPLCMRQARDMVDPATLAAAQAGIL